MTAGTDRLAGRIADALIRLLPTADWTSELAGDIAQILGGRDPVRVTAVSSELRASRDLLGQADPGHRDHLEIGLYEQWDDWLQRLLSADPAPPERAEAVLSALQAVTGISGGRPHPGGGVPRVTRAGSAEGAVRDRNPGPEPARYLLGRCPEVVPVGKPFSLLASIVQSGESGAAPLLSFAGPADILLVLHAPGLRLLGDQRQLAHVPASGDSSPVMFELQADAEGPRSISLTAWLGGSYLGELLVAVTAESVRVRGPDRSFRSELAIESSEGAVSLVVRYDPDRHAYRFEFRDEDYPDEVVSKLSFEPRQRIERLVSDLDRLAAGSSGYSADQVRDYLVNAGAALWHELVPPGLHEQFWDRQHRIRQLTILADKDTVPWELLYPKDPGHDAGFLVEQFPVGRGIFGKRPASGLSLQPARFVLPRGSLPEAEAEIDAMRRLLDPAQATGDVVSDLTPLLDLIRTGDFGLLHFACHNRFEPDDDASIKLGTAQFTPTFLTTAVIEKALARSAPTVFMNACRSAGLAPTYNRLDGWASKFLEAGAGAFIGSQWAVSDGAAREFAEEFYAQLRTGATLGLAMMNARAKAATHADDPTWLAYAVYGDPRAQSRTPDGKGEGDHGDH
jgi:hypothetical protein